MIISNIFPFEVLHFGEAKNVPVQNALKGFSEKVWSAFDMTWYKNNNIWCSCNFTCSVL